MESMVLTSFTDFSIAFVFSVAVPICGTLVQS